jgi:hypothetical protein
MHKRILIVSISLLALTACDSAETPLDAADRLRIDSTSAAQIRLSRIELDSLCQAERRSQLPQLIDSIRTIRLREIEEKMKTVPR